MADLYLSSEGPLKKLLEDLEEVYPHQNIDPSSSHDLIMYRAGQRSVVDYIKAMTEDERSETAFS